LFYLFIFTKKPYLDAGLPMICLLLFTFIFAELHRGESWPWWKTSLGPKCN